MYAQTALIKGDALYMYVSLYTFLSRVHRLPSPPNKHFRTIGLYTQQMNHNIMWKTSTGELQEQASDRSRQD